MLGTPQNRYLGGIDRVPASTWFADYSRKQCFASAGGGGGLHKLDSPEVGSPPLESHPAHSAKRLRAVVSGLSSLAAHQPHPRRWSRHWPRALGSVANALAVVPGRGCWLTMHQEILVMCERRKGHCALHNYQSDQSAGYTVRIGVLLQLHARRAASPIPFTIRVCGDFSNYGVPRAEEHGR